MAVFSILAGGVTGFLFAVFALCFLQFGWLAALGVWSLGGMGTASALLAASLLPLPGARAQLSQETA